MTSEVNDARYLAGDLSGIQRFRAAREDRVTRRLITLVRCAVNTAQPQSSTTKTMTTTPSHCASCFNARSIGAQLTRRQWTRAGRGPIRALGVAFEMLESAHRDAWRAGRWIPRHGRHGAP